MTITERIIANCEKEIIRLQIAIAEERERGGEMAEATRLDKISELRDSIAFALANADKPEEWWGN